MKEVSKDMNKKNKKGKLVVFFRRVLKKESSAWKWKLLGSSGFKWKRLNMHVSFFDDFVFKILSIFETAFLVSSICLFFLCCGCHF